VTISYSLLPSPPVASFRLYGFISFAGDVTWQLPDSLSVRIDGERAELVRKITYLGSYVTSDRLVESEVYKCIGLGSYIPGHLDEN